MLSHPVLLSAAAEIVGTALGADPNYVLGHARRFVREDLLAPAATVGNGPNRRAYIDSYGVCRLAVLSSLQRLGLHLDDLTAAARRLDRIASHPSTARNFDAIVDEFAADEAGEMTWFFHWHLLLDGTHAGGCSQSAAPDTMIANMSLAMTTLALQPVILKSLQAMRDYESSNA
jgi:hypothetical protein